MTLFQNFVHQIKSQLQLNYSYKKMRSFLASTKQKIGEQIIYYPFGISLVYLIFNGSIESVCHFIGFLVPTLLAIGLSRTTNDTKWFIYWIIYVLVGFLEYFYYDFYQNLCFYWFGKCILLIWVMLPRPMGGTNLVYYRVIRQFILNYFQKKKILYNTMVNEDKIKNANSYDQQGNLTTKECDSSRDGKLIEYRILIGQFYASGDMKATIEALEIKGFQVENVKDEVEFLLKLRSNQYQIAWVISSSDIENSTFISTLVDFHSAGGAVFLFADNTPYVSHASEFLNRKFGITLIGNYLGNKTLVFKENGCLEAGHFGQHSIFTGIEDLFEGVTICHPVCSVPTGLNAMDTLATATDGHPCIVVFDPPAGSTEGRLCLDCGFTKLFINWNSAGTASFIVNASCWLARREEIKNVRFDG